MSPPSLLDLLTTGANAVRGPMSERGMRPWASSCAGFSSHGVVPADPGISRDKAMNGGCLQKMICFRGYDVG